MTATVADVAIVGYGPVGAILANILGRAGLSVLAVDRMAGIYDKPRAINIDHEVMRVLQSVGLADAVAPSTVPHKGTDFIGLDGRVIKTFELLPEPYPLHWTPNMMFVQPEFEPVIRAGATRFSNVRVELSTVCLSCEDQGVSVLLTLEDAQGQREVRARYVVAADGAASTIRKQLGIRSESLDFDETWTVVDAWLTRDTQLPARTTQFCRPSGPATYVVGPRNLRRWEIKLLPGETAEDFADRDRLNRRLAAYVDPSALDIWRVATYRFHALIAATWRQGRIFLAGDAAHQMPPFMAQGLCSGVRDVANLGWKLAGVLSGRYDERLLDSYERERKPHIRALTATTKAIGEIIGELDPEAARRRDEAMLAERARGKTVPVRQALIPNLTDGLLASAVEGAPALAAGELFPQPRVMTAGGGIRLLDDLAGERFLLVLDGAAAVPIPPASLPSDVVGCVRLVDARPERADEIHDLDGTLSGWMRRRGMVAVMARPDRYVFGAAADADEIPRLMQALFTIVPFSSRVAA